MENIYIYKVEYWKKKNETINLNNNDIIYTMRVGHYEKFDRMFPIFIDMSKDVYDKLLTDEYYLMPSCTIDCPFIVHDGEDHIVPIVKPALEAKNHIARTKQKKY